MKHSFIAIEGNIGAGKTTLARKLATDLNGQVVEEKFENNPFLSNFYDSPKRYAFLTEIHFLLERVQQLKYLATQAEQQRSLMISDFLFQKCLIFAAINLLDSDVALFKQLFDRLNDDMPIPDLILYLDVPVEQLKQQITKRGRIYERAIKLEYLEKIRRGYFEFFKKQQDLPVVIISTSKLDWMERKVDYDRIVALTEQSFSPGIHYIE